ncbi:putative ABC-type transport system, permease component [Marinomonas sp. MED121]|uniref:ABC transporter permease n=1 Tax=Marinomonas sp. MED121 TaxID=314277 RepID=UPI000069058C|nr:ABC transporter permease subunit [Marinomonas sp. MED121]EAQ63653.1 putative ABC-type transport system, permease component [Marinomonas sp. MED121]
MIKQSFFHYFAKLTCLRLLSILITIGLISPIILGLAGTVLPAFDYLPALSHYTFSLKPWHNLFQSPEVYGSLKLTLISGLLATFLSFIIAFSTIAVFYESRWLISIRHTLAPILAIPHAAIAIGLVFVLSPSGWLVRLFSPWLTQYERPPIWVSVQDPYALSLVLALIVKETPYLLFVILASLDQIKTCELIKVGTSMGYSRLSVWRKVIFPLLYPLIRLPLLVILAFSLTVVDLSLVIGPNTPSTFAVTLFHWYNDTNLDKRFTASAGAVLLMLIILVSALFWESCYQVITRFDRYRWSNGKRHTLFAPLLKGAAFSYIICVVLALLSLFVLPIWAFTQRWRFPDVLPSSWSFKKIEQLSPLLFDLACVSLVIAFISTLLALAISILMLEQKRLKPANTKWFDRFIYLPMILPQVGFLFGIQVFLIWSNNSGSLLAVIGLHLLYVLPYVYLTLSGPYLAYNQDFYVQAICLNKHPTASFFKIKLAMLKPALFSAFALGIAVSFAQYLPTLTAGEGRINTLTTEAVALAASGERKKVGNMAMLQALFPLVIFMLAQWLPRVWTNYRLNFQSIFR